VDTLANQETPVVLVDLGVLERNIADMAQGCRLDGVRLRPHAKTHKCVEIARLQLMAGAAGLSVAKLDEAEVFAAAGCQDLFVAFPVVGADKGERLLRLSDRARIAVGVDSVAGAETLATIFERANRKLDVLLKVDVGFRRAGVLPEDALAVAQGIARLSGLRLRGVFTFAGHVYSATSPAEIEAIGRAEGETLVTVADRLRRAGFAIDEVSVGSTPTAAVARAIPGVTETRPGNYVFHDASQVNLGVCAIESCALTVLATVVSVPSPERAVLDAGSKSLSKDPLAPSGGGFGWLLGRSSRIAALSEEHAVVRVEPGESLRVGERVRILPNHCCVVVNLTDRLLGTRGNRVECSWPVVARGSR
jgi:D-serine deaminase-like pyridoxal phosphate-dependent protein